MILPVALLVAVLGSPALSSTPSSTASSTASSTPSSTASSTASSTPSCAGHLDATTACPGPAAEPAPVAPDAPVVEAPSRDPALFPRELAFVSVLSGALGGGLVAVATAPPVRPLLGDDPVVHDVTLWTGASLLALGGLLAGSAVATAVFDPSTGGLRCNPFVGED